MIIKYEIDNDCVGCPQGCIHCGRGNYRVPIAVQQILLKIFLEYPLLLLLHLFDLETESDVLKYVEVGEQCISLKNGVQLSLVSGDVSYVLTVEHDGTLVGFNETAEDSEKSSLTATGRTE